MPQDIDPPTLPAIDLQDNRQQQLIGCGHELQRLSAQMDILRRATCYDETNTVGYAEFIQQLRQQVSAIAEQVIFLAHQGPPQSGSFSE